MLNFRKNRIPFYFRLPILLFFIYIVSVILVVVRESSYLYYPEPVQTHNLNPGSAGLEFSDVSIPVPEINQNVHGWWIPGNKTEPVILFFHGNAGHLGHRVDIFRYIHKLKNSAFSILAIDFPGYGLSQGVPSENSLFAAGLSALQFLESELNVKPDRIVIYGRSLGAAVALNTAVEGNQCKGIILESAFLSVPQMAKEVLPFLPGLKFLSRQRFDNEKRIKDLTIPVLIMHGKKDQVVPYSHGFKLHSIAPEPRKFVGFESAGHDDPYLLGQPQHRESILSFISELFPEKPLKPE